MGWLLTAEHVKDADIVDMMDPIPDSGGTSAYSIALLVYNRKGKGKYVRLLGSFLSKRRKKEKNCLNGGFALLNFVGIGFDGEKLKGCVVMIFIG